MIGLNEIILIISFVISLVFGSYGLYIYFKLKGSSLAKIILSSTLAILVLGFHHFTEVLFEHLEGLSYLLAESAEIVAALLLLMAVYYVYKLSREIFVPEHSPLKNIKNERIKKSKKYKK
ncbi:MAG: hypothetical protein AABY40_02890 [Nanoarchaeota archaeon]